MQEFFQALVVFIVFVVITLGISIWAIIKLEDGSVDNLLDTLVKKWRRKKR